MTPAVTTMLSADAVVADGHVWSPGWIRTAGAHIAQCGDGVPPPSSGAIHVKGTVVPGFVDIHTHGAGGADFSAAPDSSVLAAVDWHAKHGTTSVVASLASAPLPDLQRQVSALADLVLDGVILGVHLEGPWLSAGHRGAHAASLLRSPARAEVETLAINNDVVRMVTLAPELPGGLAAIAAIAGAGKVAAIGHTSCDTATALAAVDAGATVATHLYNGMPPLHHREPGPVGIALVDERVFAELILDGRHVAPPAVELAVRLLDGRLVAVSDSIAATGCADGHYTLAGTPIDVVGGVAVTRETASLAGSTSTLDTAFRSLIEYHGRSLAEAVTATSTAPARALGLADVGVIRPGAAADLVVLDDLEVVGVMKGGRWVTRPPLC